MEIEEEQKQNQQPQINDSSEEQAKTIAKQKKKLKKQKKEQMALQQFSYKNLMVKDLSYEKKIFLYTDLVVDLNLFTDEQFGRSNKFDAISCWRPPVKIEQENNLVHISLDTSVDGLINFDQISNILNSIPNQDAHDLSINKDNMFRILYQNGPLQYFSSQDKIKRMKESLSVRINQLEAFHQDKEEKMLPNQTIITFDDLQFQCDITMIKDNMAKDENFYVQQVFMIQIALYDISEEVVQQIQSIRQLNSNKQQLQDDLKELYQGLEYETQSEIFLSKFYNI
ncbi:hypothetical protein ABPG73_000396 [Tetrahymena malaccensis]